MYVKRSPKLKPSKAALDLACKYADNGMALTRVSKLLGISYPHLREYWMEREKQKKNSKVVKKDEVFDSQQELEVKEMIKSCSALTYGLTDRECRLLVFETARLYNFEIPDSWVKKGSADADWLKVFQKRNPDITLEGRYRCGPINNATKQHKKNMSIFYDTLETIFLKNPLVKDPMRIYCLGEIYTNKRPGDDSYVNKDSNKKIITTCCFLNASGSYLPLVNIFPTKLKNRCAHLPGTLNLFTLNGMLDRNDFTKIIEHFVNHSHSSPETPSILIMDSSINHLSIEALRLAKQSGVHLISVHCHVSSILLPLTAGLSDLFKSYYNKVEALWLADNYENISQYDNAQIIGEAYEKAMTPQNIKNAFQKCGIYPFDRDLLSGDEVQTDYKNLPCPECKVRNEISNFIKLKDSQKESAGIDSSEIQDLERVTTENVEESKTNQAVTNKKYRLGPKMPTSGADELDKLKRRMIRTVARLLKEKKSEEEVWEELAKESGSNCKALWDRMKSLTLKKLKRHQEADDKVDLVPAVARMTLTDWLLYDMIIVHENMDSAGEEELMSSKVLPQLFSLVQMFNIEGSSGNALAEAWTSATLYYNSHGYQCSPMMMQRRWYELKKVTRHKFYRFWFTYRGNNRLLQLAKQDAPTELQRNVALRFPHVIVGQFLTWEEMITRRLIIMPEEFQDKMRSMHGQSFVKTKRNDGPDIIVVEPKVDTICLGDSDSDTEEKYAQESKGTENDPETDFEQTPVIVQVKTEPQDHIDVEQEQEPSFYDKIEQYIEREENKIIDYLGDGLETVRTSHGVNVPIEHSRANIEDVDTNSQQSILIDDDDDDAVTQNADDCIQNEDIDNQENEEVDHQNKNMDDDTENVNANDNQNDIIDVVKHEPVDGVVDENNAQDVITSEDNILPVISAIISGEEAEIKTEVQQECTQENTSDDDDDIIMLKDSEDEEKTAHLPKMSEIPSNLNFADDGIEFADDGIEYVDEDDENQENDTEDTQIDNDTKEDQAQPKFDLKLLMNPVVYTTKLDHMSVFNGSLIHDTIVQKEILDNILLESKPVSAMSINVETAKENIQADNQEEVYNDVQNDDLFHNDVTDKSDDESVDESMKVKPTSYLLQKPRNRSYHPIQICKNPDFNTRLKRINVGFFSSSRNRLFLKACKPLTIDLSKAFESKLINGTLYLKKPDSVQNVQEKIDNNESTVSCSSILPSAVPVPSLMPQDTTDVDKILQQELKRRMQERVINLPHISVVRQINEQLQKAEVAPIMAQNIKHDIIESLSKETPDTTLIDDPKKSVIEIEVKTETEKHAVFLGDKTSNKEKISNIPVVDTNQSKVDKSRKKKKQMFPSWTTKTKYVENVSDNEMLLTSDTLYKMLIALDPGCLKKISQFKENLPNKRKQLEIFKQHTFTFRNEDLNEDRDVVELKNTPSPEPSVDKVVEKAVDKVVEKAVDKVVEEKNKEATNNDKPTETLQNLLENGPPLSAASRRGRGRKRCCWCNYKIDKLLHDIKSYIKHICPPGDCRCCCQQKLLIVQMQRQEERRKVQGIKFALRNESQSSSSNYMAPKTKTSVEVQTDFKQNDSTDPKPSGEIVHSVVEDKGNDGTTQTESRKNIRIFSGKLRTRRTPLTKIVPLRVDDSSFNRTISRKQLICSCQANVSVDKLDRKLVIDASNECPVHKPRLVKSPIKDTKIYMQRNNTTERPYYLGKNKILLTDKKRPVPKVVDPATLIVPKGVQVVLLPDGTITYTVQPGVELTQDELANMPVILAAIQQQFQSAGIQIPLTADRLSVSNEIIDLDNLKDTSVTTIEGTNENREASTDSVGKQMDETNTHENMITAKVTGDIKESTVNEDEIESLAASQSDVIKDIDAGKDNSEQNTDVQDAQPSKEICEEPNMSTNQEEEDCCIVDSSSKQISEEPNMSTNQEEEDCCIVDSSSKQISEEPNMSTNEETEANNSNLEKDNVVNAGQTSRNLLSDLMEMSGIVEEDVAPAPEPEIANINEPVPEELLQAPPLLPISDTQTAQPTNTQELHPVTSFADLKYACDNGGHFYKLDLTNGIIVPIHVGIQKTSSRSVAKKNAASGEVIDLTDDIGSEVVELNTSDVTGPTSDNDTYETNYTYENASAGEETVSDSAPTSTLKMNLTHAFKTLINAQKQIKIYKPTPTSILKKKPNLLKKSIHNLLPGSACLSPSAQALLKRINALRPLKLLQAKQQANIVRHRRKQSLLKRPIDRTVNLNKIEANIDLVDSDEPMEEEYLEDDSSDDSSDDEPLAKVAKRMRGEESCSDVSPQIEAVGEEPKEPENVEMLDEELLAREPPQVDNDTDPRPTQLVLSGKAMEDLNIMNSFMPAEAADDEDSQEDCILGV